MNITGMLHEHHLLGVAIGAATFLIIGLFHPLVVKGHYHFGVGCRWWFLGAGAVCLALAVAAADDVLLSSLLGVVAFSCFWSVREVAEQQRRVDKGWFPANPRRRRPA